MRVALLTYGAVPNPTAGGGTLTNWTLATHLLSEGHEVVSLPLLPPAWYVDPTGTPVGERIRRLEALGAEVVPVESATDVEASKGEAGLAARLRRAWRPEPEFLFPTLADREAVGAALAEQRPDVAFIYHWEALAASHGFRQVPKLGVTVDLSHLVQLYRWRRSLRLSTPGALRGLVQLQRVLRCHPRLLVRFLRDCDAAGNFAAHHAAWLRRKGASHCEYLRTPIPDPVGPAWRTERERFRSRERARILLIGHLKGIATMDGLEVFAKEVLPRLERALDPESFEVRLVGGYDPPAELERALDRPSVTLCGHREDPGEEFLAANVVLVPTSIPLGTRVRILSAFSYGACVVAHDSNALGIPELAHGDNVLLGHTPRDLARAVVAALRDEELRLRLEAGGRETFERYFAPSVAAARISSILERLVSSRSRVPAA